MDTIEDSKKKKIEKILFFLLPILYVIFSIVMVYFVSQNGRYPSGSDTMYHIHRADLVYQNWVKGNHWVLLDDSWYNGVEILRYWPPLTAYFMAFCEALAGGSTFNGYLVFIGLMAVLFSMMWWSLGFRTKRYMFCGFLGLIWFYMPMNLFLFFETGNLPRAMSMLFIPLFYFHIIMYLHEKKHGDLIHIIILTVLIVFCHLGFAGMLALNLFLFLIVYMLVNRTTKGVLDVIVSVVLGFVCCGLWLIPSLKGGIGNIDSSETMKNFFQNLFTVTLNPVGHFTSYEISTYFGLAVFIIAFIGAFLAEKSASPGFITTFITVLLSTTTAYPLVSKLPLGSYLWMTRFFSIVISLSMVSLLVWRKLNKKVLTVFCIMLVVDTVPYFHSIYGYRNGMQPEVRFDETQQETLLDEAQKITTQRLCVLNEGSYGSIDAYIISDWGKKTKITFGAGWEASVTADNIRFLNRAANEQKLYYLFDRAKELGNDTVLFRNDVILHRTNDFEERMDTAAAASGYVLIDSNEDFRLYHLSDASEHFGFVNKYRAIAIGTAANEIALDFPAFEVGGETDLQKYSYDELSGYDIVFLDGFTYEDRDVVENMVKKLADHGVHIVIAADGTPADPVSHENRFLGFTMNNIEFTGGYPDIKTEDENIIPNLFPADYTDWPTVFVDGLDNVYAWVYDNDVELPFIGTVYNDNISVFGLDLAKYYGLTGDKNVGKLLSRIFEMDNTELPERTLVPLTYERTKSSIKFVSPENNVDTGLSFHDIFHSEQKLYRKNNLLYIDKGTTIIKMKYPYFWSGLFVTILGVVLSILFVIYRKQYKDPAEKTEVNSDAEDDAAEAEKPVEIGADKDTA